jgi:ribulose 1,5-bisphosphate synthetase/thiazole synthase
MNINQIVSENPLKLLKKAAKAASTTNSSAKQLDLFNDYYQSQLKVVKSIAQINDPEQFAAALIKQATKVDNVVPNSININDVAKPDRETVRSLVKNITEVRKSVVANKPNERATQTLANNLAEAMAKHPDADLSQLFSELLSQSKALKKRSKLEQVVNTTLTVLASIMIIVGTLRVVGFLQAVKDSTENDR